MVYDGLTTPLRAFPGGDKVAAHLVEALGGSAIQHDIRGPAATSVSCIVCLSQVAPVIAHLGTVVTLRRLLTNPRPVDPQGAGAGGGDRVHRTAGVGFLEHDDRF